MGLISARNGPVYASVPYWNFFLFLNFLLALLFYRLWGPPSLLYSGYRGSFPRGRELVGAIPPLPQAPPWCVAGLLYLFYLFSIKIT
jgi:hypothetical protein